jgi:23S rRNA pseudouridine1911/1915/1917 synthase
MTPDAIDLTVPAEAAGARLDRYLAERLPERSRSQLQRLIHAGQVQVNGQAARPALRLEAGDRVVMTPAAAPDSIVDPAPASDVPLAVLYFDEWLIVVDKAAGVVVHPAAGHADGTLANALVARFPDLTAAFEGRRPGIVHRLDKDTSGVMVVGRTIAAADALMRQFRERGVEKVYLALVKGAVAPPAGVIEAPVARDRHDRKRMAARAGGRPAETAYRVLGTAGDYSWVEARPRTGRTHQIRVHFAAIGHPVAGDPVYGRRDRYVPRLALHAWRLAFQHPTTGARLTFTAPLPPDLAAALAALGLPAPPTADPPAA